MVDSKARMGECCYNSVLRCGVPHAPNSPAPRRSAADVSVVLGVLLVEIVVTLGGDFWAIVTVDECFGVEKAQVYCNPTVEVVALLLPWLGIVACAAGMMPRWRGWRHYGWLLWAATMVAPIALGIAAMAYRATRAAY